MQSFLKNVVWGCLIIIPFLVLYVASGHALDVFSWFSNSGMYFPYISGKNFAFRILVEVAFASWVILALYNPHYRFNIKKTPLFIAYGVFMAVLLLADVFGVDAMKSMWSNYERMEGFVGHIHLFAYFVVLVAMLRTITDWSKMFKVLFASNIVVLVYAYGQLLGAQGYIFAKLFPQMAAWFSAKFPISMSVNRLDATLGNSAYFAIYCLMFIFLYALVWSHSKHPTRNWFYPTLIVLNLVALFYSGTRGTMIGILVGGVVALGIEAFHEKGKTRKIFIGVLVALVVTVGALFAFEKSTFVQSSPSLARLASISPTDVTTSSRLVMWKISYEAWKEKPILGYGQDNFDYVFARKFVPEKMYNLEPWYDRSHDVFFDWLIAGGILGLFSYLSLYVVSMWLVWRKKSDMTTRERAVITGLLVGYFIHNIFVFDNLISYILFVIVLAYITMRSSTHLVPHTGKHVSADAIKMIWAPIVAIALVGTLYYVNYRPLLVNALVIEALDVNRLAQTNPITEVLRIQQEALVKAVGMNTLGSTEAREQFSQIVLRMGQINLPEGTTAEDRQAYGVALNTLVQAARKDITESLPMYEDNARMLSIFGMFYNGIGDGATAEQILSLAHSIAPNKQLISFDLTRAYLIQNKFSEAYALSKETYKLVPQYKDAQKWYLLSAAYAGTYKDARADIVADGQTVPFDQDVLNALVSTKQIALAIELLNELKKTNPELQAQIDEYIKLLLAAPKN